MSEKIHLEVLDPRGEIENILKHGISPRLTTLEGKRIALIDNQKSGARTLLDVLETLLKARYPSTTFVRQYSASINLAKEPEFYDEVAKSADAFIFGAGD